MIPGMVPVALLVARTDTHAVLIDNLLVYPTGFDFDLAVRRRPGRPRDHRHRGRRTSAGGPLRRRPQRRQRPPPLAPPQR
jgi:hypothetical protein